MKQQAKIDQSLENLFAESAQDNQLGDYIRECQLELYSKHTIESPRFSFLESKDVENLTKEYSVIPEGISSDLLELTKKIAIDFFDKVPKWRNPALLYNVGTAVNTPASAIYALANDENIFNINDGLGGKSISAEQIVAKALASLAGIEKPVVGFFTFGGTATNYYATKIGILKCDPSSRLNGISRKIRSIVTQDSHFSHKQVADWLGFGMNNVIEVKAAEDRTTDLVDLESKIDSLLKDKKLLAAIIINGGTTYNHTIDDIKKVVAIRDQLYKKYQLSYKPHIHVDSVIGWSWLSFKGYDFEKNPLEIKPEALKKIKQQYKKISQVKLADSWSADFHKGTGSTPVPSSIFILNTKDDLKYLDKLSEGSTFHAIAPDYSVYSPADFTIETSRPAGAPLSALATLHALGLEGLRRRLAGLVEGTVSLREPLRQKTNIEILNDKDSLGFVTMLRVLPPGISKELFRANNLKNKTMVNKYVNEYTKRFFEWDKKTRTDKGAGPEYSFSKGFQIGKDNFPVSGIKIYPVSPFFNTKIAKKTAEIIIKQKELFDQENLHSSQIQIDNLAKIVADAIGLDDFVLYGGAIIDTFLNLKLKFLDLDILVKGKEKRSHVINHLEKRGYKIIEHQREFLMSNDIAVTLVYAIKGDLFLDVGFIEEIEQFKPPFTIESAFYDNKSHQYKGIIQAILDLNTKRMWPTANTLSKGNPYSLLSRAFYLMAKYDFDMSDDGNREIILLLTSRVKTEGTVKDDRYYSCLNAFFKSVCKAKNKNLFINELMALGVFDLLIPESRPLTKEGRLLISENKMIIKNQLIEAIGDKMSGSKKASYNIRISELKKRRYWESI